MTKKFDYEEHKKRMLKIVRPPEVVQEQPSTPNLMRFLRRKNKQTTGVIKSPLG